MLDQRERVVCVARQEPQGLLRHTEQPFQLHRLNPPGGSAQLSRDHIERTANPNHDRGGQTILVPMNPDLLLRISEPDQDDLRLGLVDSSQQLFMIHVI
jgi:hypothetical protein